MKSKQFFILFYFTLLLMDLLFFFLFAIQGESSAGDGRPPGEEPDSDEDPRGRENHARGDADADQEEGRV